MEYDIKFILFYLLLQSILITCSYFYYNNYIKNIYLKNGKLTVFAGFSQLGVFTVHGFLLYLPYYLYTDWPKIEVGLISYVVAILVCIISFSILILGFITLGPSLRTMGINSLDLTITWGSTDFQGTRRSSVTDYCCSVLVCYGLHGIFLPG